MVVAMAATLVACEKDDSTSSSTSGTNSSIVGTWEGTNARYVEKVNGQTIDDTTEIYAAGEFLATFNANGTGVINESGSLDTFNYNLSGNQLALISIDPVFGNDTTILTATITSTTLKLFAEANEVYDSVNYYYSSEINFRKK